MKKDVSKIVDPDKHYLVLAIAACNDERGTTRKSCFLMISKIDYIIPDTPENREFLSRKWSETRVLYDLPEMRYRPKGRDIDM